MYSVIKKPLITEKNTILSGAGVYVFEVEKTATKDDIRNAVAKIFDVKVESVKTMVCRDRTRKVGANMSKVKYWKKALVKLKAGEKISLFEGA